MRDKMDTTLVKIDKNFLEKIEKLGQLYYAKYLNNWPDNVLSENWWIALKFFFSHSFMRGRRDQLSHEYYTYTIKILEEFFNLNRNTNFRNLKNSSHILGSDIIKQFKKDKAIGRKNSLEHQDFQAIKEEKPLIKALTTKKEIEIEWIETQYTKKLFLGNDTDIMMVLDTLKFITEDNNRSNLYAYVKNKLENGTIKDTYDELIDNIYGVNDKIASFFIRDILMLNPDIQVDQNYVEYAFPIDTWVFNISGKLGIKSNNIRYIKKCFIQSATDIKLCPLKIAAGLWYLGFNCLEILMESYFHNA